MLHFACIFYVSVQSRLYMFSREIDFEKQSKLLNVIVCSQSDKLGLFFQSLKDARELNTNATCKLQRALQRLVSQKLLYSQFLAKTWSPSATL